METWGDVVYSCVASNSQMDSTIQEMEELLPDLLLAEIEKTCQLKNDEISTPSGQWIGICDTSDLKETIYYIEMKLEEITNLVRILKVK